MSSDTSSDINLNDADIIDRSGRKINTDPKQTTTTDYHFSLLANPSKVMEDEKESESESELSEVRVRSESSRSSSSSSVRTPKSPRGFTGIDSNVQKQIYESKDDDIFARQSEIPKMLSPQEARMKKIEMLRRLSELKAKGFQLSKEYDFNSSLEEMEYEYDLLKSFVDKRNGVKMYKSMLLQGISLIEFLNDKYDPFDFHLRGWSEHMSVEADNWEDVLEEIYEKYKGSGKSMDPVLKLGLLVLASGASFHFAKAQSGIPGIESVLPNIIKGKQKQPSQFLTPQELNILRQKEMLKKKFNEIKSEEPPKPHFIPNMTSNENLKTQNIANPMASNAKGQPFSSSIPKSSVPEITTPKDVQAILAKMKQQQIVRNMPTSETQEETTSNNDRLVSDSNVSESKRRGRKPKVQSVKLNF